VITARVKGMPALQAKLRAMQRECRSAIREASIAGATPLHDEAERIAPRGNDARGLGHLADHIEMQVTKATATQCQIRIGPDADHWYGRFPETGTVKMAAQPYLRPAADTKMDEARQEFSAVMKRRLG
jgi:HK97 gp10 family phage protein